MTVGCQNFHKKIYWTKVLEAYYQHQLKDNVHVNINLEDFSLVMLCTPVFIFTSGSSALLGLFYQSDCHY